ncbi:MAG: IucA/IucC family protein [Mycobacteriales bacterium]
MTGLLATPVPQRAGAETLRVLLRCWLRETGVAVGGPGLLQLPLPATGRALVLDVLRRSPTGQHDLGQVTRPDGGGLDLPDVARLLLEEAAARAGLPAVHAEAAVARVLDSARRTARYAAARAAAPDPPAGLPRWLAAEQDLLAGHPFHPMAKSREELPDAEDDLLAPELRGHFPLHWYAAREGVVASGSAGLDVGALLRELAGDVRVPAGFVPVPAHPWQAARLSSRPAAAALLDAGDLLDLGPGGAPWWPTSSVRTVGRPGAAVMLKLSLGLRVTNSRRDNLRSELTLGTRTARLVDAGVGRALAATHPGFTLVRDPAWVGVDGHGPVGLDTVVRDVPFDARDDIACAGALVDARPDRGRPVVVDLVERLATRRELSRPAATLSWYRGFLAAVATPLLWLHGEHGLGLEAHLQNLLVGLDADGRPDRGWYRDNQGWYLAASHEARAQALLPGVGDGVSLVFDDALVTDRVVYYLGVNTLLGVAGALSAAGLAEEHDLLRVLADTLRAHLRTPRPSPAAAVLLDADHLRVKANLLTGVDGRDELDGPVTTQSVYVAMPNPLREL